MADRKISDLTALTTPASGDFLPIVDISEAAAASKNKRITIEELMRGVPDGTAAAPGIAFETDPNTGIYSPGADQLAVATNGTGRLSIDASGNVAVATNTLYVDAVSNRVGINTTTFATGSKLAIATSAGKFDICGDGGSSVRLINGGGITFDSGSGHFFNQGASEFMRITSTGLVGVGVSSPSYLLDVAGGSAS